MQEQVTLPDIYCPFPFRVNPEAARVEAHTNAWVQQTGIVSNDAEMKRFRASRFPWLAAYVHPTVGYDELVLVSDLISWQFLLDNMFDGPLGEQPRVAQGAISEFMGVLTSQHIAEPDISRLAYPHMTLALHDVWKRIFSRGTPLWRYRFSRNMTTYIAANGWEARNRAQKSVPDTNSSMANRELTIGMWPAMDMIDIVEHLILPAHIYESQDFQTLLRAAAIHVVLVNDLFSQRKEEAIEDCNNLVIQLQKLKQYTLQEAQSQVSKMISEQTTLYLDTLDRLLEVYPDYAEEIVRYAGNLQGWMRGNIDWSAETMRYNHVPIHNHIVASLHN